MSDCLSFYIGSLDATIGGGGGGAEQRTNK
jgi:hypothetical protein